MFLLIHLECGSYSVLLKIINKLTYLGLYEYPKSLTSTYEILVFNSGNMSNNRHPYDHVNAHRGGRGSRKTSVIFAH